MLDLELMSVVAEQMMSAEKVEARGCTWPVGRTSSQRLRTVRFEMAGGQYQAIEQNPDKPSRWGQLARQGRRVVQFRDVATGRYVAVALDGKVKEYTRP
jgi:hypothetical protein